MGDRLINIERAWFISTPSQQMCDGVKADLRRKGWLLDCEIPCSSDQRRRCRVRMRCAVERQIEVFRGLGGGEPFALGPVLSIKSTRILRASRSG